MIRPIKFNSDGTIEVLHDDPGYDHRGSLNIDDAAKLDFAIHPSNGTRLYNYITINCPFTGCNSQSVWPISGGGDPERGQEMFIRKLRRSSESIPGLTVLPAQARGRRPLQQVKDFVRERADALDGPGRFRHNNMNSVDD